MPPKSIARAAQDWSWVGAEAATIADITPEHRRRAAGLVGLCACPSRVEGTTTTTAEPPAEDEQMKEEKEEDQSKDAAPASQCGPKKCRTNPRCYNHIGGKEVR
jgi:ubiquitin carboxyl-terminal hydrolase 48